MKTIEVLERILKNHYDMRVERIKDGTIRADYIESQGGIPDYDVLFKKDPMDDAFISYANMYGRLMKSERLRDTIIEAYINAK